MLNWNTQKDQEVYNKGKKTYLDDVINRAKKNMSQTNFMKHDDWNKNNTSVTLNGHIRKNEFLKSKRMTFNDEIERHAKVYKVPGIGEYVNFPIDRIPSVPKQTSQQRAMLDDAMWKASQVPGCKYDTSCYIKLKPRVLETKIYNAKQQKSEWKIQKTKDTSPGQYEDMDSFRKTQIKLRNHNVITSKA